MAIGLEDKKAIVAEVNETAASALSLVIADARGVHPNDMTALRASLAKNKFTLRVVRNTLAKRALEGTDYECVTDTLCRSLPVSDFRWKIRAQRLDCSKISPRQRRIRS